MFGVWRVRWGTTRRRTEVRIKAEQGGCHAAAASAAADHHGGDAGTDGESRALSMGAEMVIPAMDLMYDLLGTFLPSPPVSATASLSADSSAPGGGSEDSLSALPDQIHRNVVSRLPAKDVARTAILSSRWRPLWRSSSFSSTPSSSNRPAPRTHPCAREAQAQ